MANFYEVTADYILARSDNRNHPDAEIAELHLSDEIIGLLKSGRIDNGLLCELAAHPDFPGLWRLTVWKPGKIPMWMRERS